MPSTTPILRRSDWLEGITPYRPPAFDPGIDLRLDANEGPAPADDLLGQLARIDGEQLRRYPNAGALEGAIAERWGLPSNRVVVTNGGDDAIDRLCRATLQPGRTLVTHRPTFEMIGRGARLVGAQAHELPWIDGESPAAPLMSAIDDATGLVAVVSPNNPTGGVVSVPTILRIAEAARRVGAVMLVDLAYVEFADADPTRDLLGLDNAVLVRTFSKAYGLAGLRVGYALAPSSVAEWLRTTGGPYPVSTVSLVLAGAAYAADSGPREAYVARVRDERAVLSDRLHARGARPLTSQANFVSAYVGDAFLVRDGLAARGIAVRAFRAGGELANLLRITLPGDSGAFTRLLASIDEIQEGWS